jgi:hypothetical protein
VENVKCTTDDDLTVKDIAAISTNAKTIIAIDTGPSAGLYNKFTIQNSTTYMLCENSKCNTSFSIRKNNIHDMMFLLEEDNKEGFFIDSKNYYKNIHYIFLLIILSAIVCVCTMKSSVINSIKRFVQRFFIRMKMQVL